MKMNVVCKFSLPKILTIMTVAIFLLVALPTTSEARSPRGFVTHHLKNLKKNVNEAKAGVNKALKAGEKLKSPLIILTLR